MKHFKIISLALVICMLASLVTCFAVSGETVDDYCLADLRFTQANESLTLDGAHVVAETIDGVITIQLDSDEATITMSATNSIDVLSTEKHPYFVFDFAGDVKVDSMYAHYTRKDKAEGTYADLYLASMNAAENYASYRVGDKFLCSEDGTDSYGIWDWGKYLCPDPSNPPAAKVFDDGIHSFKDVTCKLSGEVGKRITFYKFGVYSTSDSTALSLGASTAEATNPTADDYCLADLRFSSSNDTLSLEGAKVVAEKNGVVTIELTAETATITMDTTNAFSVLDTKKHPYFVFDFAGDVKVDSMIAHYTRKDKGEKCADLYLNSMNADDNYASNRVGDKFLCSEDGTDSYGIWDWGKYLCPDPSNPPAAKVFDDGIHAFNDVVCKLSGEVGKRITFYKFGVYFTSDDSVLELGSSCGEADMEVIKISHVNNYNSGFHEAMILNQAGKTEKEITTWESKWWRMYVVENVDGRYIATKYYRNTDEVITTKVPKDGFLLYIYGDHDAAKFDDDLLGYEFYDLEGVVAKDSLAIDTSLKPAMNLYARLPEPVLNPDDYTIHPSVNTSITTNAKTIVTDPSTAANYNPNWSGRVLLAPTETPGIYTVVETQKPNGSAPTFTETIGEGYIILLLHGESGEPDGEMRDRWLALEPGTEIVVSGYNFEADLINEDAYATIYTDQVPVIPQPEEQPSEDPSQDPSQDPELPPTGDSGIVAIAILAVVALFGSAIVIKVRH